MQLQALPECDPLSCESLAEQCAIFGGSWSGASYECVQDDWYSAICWFGPTPYFAFCCGGDPAVCEQCRQPSSSYECQAGYCN